MLRLRTPTAIHAICWTSAAAAVFLGVGFLPARAGGESLPLCNTCDGIAAQIPGGGGGVDRHWVYDNDPLPDPNDPSSGYRCAVGGPTNCWPGGPRNPWWTLHANAQNAATLGAVIRNLQSFSGNTGPSAGGSTVGWVAINSQLMLIKRSTVQRASAASAKSMTARTMPMVEAIKALNIDPRSLAYPYAERSSAEGSVRICWGADSSGRVYRVNGKGICLFPARLIAARAPTGAHDASLSAITARVNETLARAAAQNRDPNVELMIAMVADRPALVWVQKSEPQGRLTVGPDSPTEEVKRALQLGD